MDVIKDIEKKYKQSDKKDRVSISFVLPGQRQDQEEEEGGADTADTAETRDSSSRKQTKSSKLLTTTIISCDRPKITEVLFNVIDNAVKFTDSVTVSIHLEADYYDHPHSHYHDHADNHASVSSSNKNGDEIPIIMGDVTVSVTDSGQGIDASIKDRLFEKFVTTSNKGTGLGLYLSKKIVELHDGKMWAMNNPDGKKGATFTFRMPIKKKQKLS